MPVFPGSVIPVKGVFEYLIGYTQSFPTHNRMKIFIKNSPARRPRLPCEIPVRSVPPHGFPSALIMHKAQCVGLVAKNVCTMPANADLQRNESALSGLPILF